VFGVLQLPQQDGRPKSSTGQFVVARNEAKPAMPGEIESRLGVRPWSALAIAPNAVRGRSWVLECWSAGEAKTSPTGFQVPATGFMPRRLDLQLG
jgi:hypothetical protein